MRGRKAPPGTLQPQVRGKAAARLLAAGLEGTSSPHPGWHTQDADQALAGQPGQPPKGGGATRRNDPRQQVTRRLAQGPATPGAPRRPAIHPNNQADGTLGMLHALKRLPGSLRRDYLGKIAPI